MSTAAKRLPPAAAWALGAFAAVVFYLLSAPAVRYATGPPIAFSRGPSFDPREAYGRACLARSYAAPYDWLEEHTLLRPILAPYARWWFDRGFTGWK